MTSIYTSSVVKPLYFSSLTDLFAYCKRNNKVPGDTMICYNPHEIENPVIAPSVYGESDRSTKYVSELVFEVDEMVSTRYITEKDASIGTTGTCLMISITKDVTSIKPLIKGQFVTKSEGIIDLDGGWYKGFDTEATLETLRDQLQEIRDIVGDRAYIPMTVHFDRYGEQNMVTSDTKLFAVMNDIVTKIQTELKLKHVVFDIYENDTNNQ